MPLNADELLLPAVKETIAALDTDDTDAAIIRLAERYAQVIDECKDPAWAMRWIGPLLHDALESLGATPVARNKTKEGRTLNGSGNRLAILRTSFSAS